MIRPRDLTAVVLAGGFGTRIRHLLGELPKPLAPVCGRPFLYWVLRYLVNQGIQDVVLSTHYEAGKVAAFAKDMASDNLHITCVEESAPLGTAGGFLHCVAQSGTAASAFLVTNGDSLVLAPLASLVEALADPGVDGAILGLDMDDASRFGQLRGDARGCLVEFSEKKPGAGTINAGVYVFRREIISGFSVARPLSFEYDVFPAVIREGKRIRIVRTSGEFIDIGTETSLAQADAFVSRHHRAFESESNSC